MAKPTRLFSATSMTPARDIMLTDPQSALEWLLGTIGALTKQVQTDMEKVGYIPAEDRVPALILTFDVQGLPAPKGEVNGTEVV